MGTKGLTPPLWRRRMADADGSHRQGGLTMTLLEIWTNIWAAIQAFITGLVEQLRLILGF